MITQFNGDEDMALQGLRPATQVIYLRGLRPFMDYQTGVVGAKRRISYTQLSECCEFIPDPRSREDPERKTKKAVICALKELERAGLIKKISGETLIFFLCLADTNKSVQNLRGISGAHEGHTIRGTEETSNDAALNTVDGHMRGTPENDLRGTHRYNGNTDNLKHNLSITSKVVGDLSGGEICRVWREMGMTHTNPSHADLLALIDAGATMRDFIHGASEAINRGKDFKYALVVTANKLKEPEKTNDKKNRSEIDTGFSEKYAGL